MKKQCNNKRVRQGVAWLRLKYQLVTALEAPFGDEFWFFHQRAIRFQDQLDQQDALAGRKSGGSR